MKIDALFSNKLDAAGATYKLCNVGLSRFRLLKNSIGKTKHSSPVIQILSLHPDGHFGKPNTDFEASQSKNLFKQSNGIWCGS